VKADVLLAGLLPDSRVSGTDEISTSLLQERSTALHHVLAILVQVGTHWIFGPSNPNFVGGINTIAAASPVDEQIIVSRLGIGVNVGRLDPSMFFRIRATGEIGPVISVQIKPLAIFFGDRWWDPARFQ